MKSVAPSTPYGYTIFCDDVRQEAGGKTSYMGVYKGKLLVNSTLPASLPKFFFVINYFERPNESAEPVTLHVYMPSDADGTPTFSAELPLDSVRSQKLELETPDSDPLIGLITIVEITPFELKSDGRIRVRAYRGDLEIRLGTLAVIGKAGEDQTPKEAPPTTKKPLPKKAARRKRGRPKKST